MSDNKTKVSGNGLGVGTLIFLIFLTLKLAEIGPVAKWSWWWVTSPLWLPIVLVSFFMVTALIIVSIINLFKTKN